MKAMSWKRDILFVLLVLILIGIFYPKFVTAEGAFLTADHSQQHFPWANLLSESIKEFKIPYWTSGIHCGFPILAEGQIGAFYLPNLLFYFFLSIKVAYAYITLFHFFLGGLFMYVYARSIGLRSLSSFFASILFVFGSTFAGGFYNVTSLKTLCWFPLALFLIEKLLRSRRLIYSLILGAVFGLSILAGYLQLAIYLCAFSSLYFIFRLAFDREEKLKAGQVSHAVLLYLIAVIISLVISGWQLWLTFQLSFLSNRTGMSESFAYIGSFSPANFITFFYPALSGVFRGSVVYVGIITMIFILLSSAKQKRWKVILWMFIAAMFLALGKYNPLYILLIKLTRIYVFRVP
ncbi:MAG: hypothetical protein ABIH42_08695, partial [Planctomycetota bacterium]